MTSRRLRTRLIIVGVLLSALLVAAIVLRIVGADEEYMVVKDLSPLAIAILAAYLASRFQERASFLTLLRAQWSEMVDAKNGLVAHIADPARDAAGYSAAYRQLSKAIDEMRGVYRNVGETSEHRGWFPYEPLHDMRDAFEAFGRKQINAPTAHERIVSAWDALRPSFLVEFETPEPERPMVFSGARDERADGPPPRRREQLMRAHAGGASQSR